MSRENGTREAILEAASQLFSQDEYRGVSMDELARRASVAKGTLYHHFGSKEALFQALTRDRSRRMLNMLERVIAGEDPVDRKLRSLTVHTFMFFVKYPAFFRLWEKSMAGGPSTRTAPFEEMRERLREMIQTVICSGMAEGIFRPVSPDTASDVLFGAVMGAVPRCLELGVEDPCTLRQREQLFDFVWEAVRARPPREEGSRAQEQTDERSGVAGTPAGSAS